MLLSEKQMFAEIIIQKILTRYGNNKIGLMFSGGKDSVVVHNIMRNIFKERPIQSYFIDSGMEFKETLSFVEKFSKREHCSIEKYLFSKRQIMHINKTNSAKEKRVILASTLRRVTRQIVKDNSLRCLIYGGRYDEPNISSGFFLEKNKLILCYPIFHFSEKDVWEYINKYKVLSNSLYKKGYSHIETMPFTMIHSQNN